MLSRAQSLACSVILVAANKERRAEYQQKWMERFMELPWGRRLDEGRES